MNVTLSFWFYRKLLYDRRRRASWFVGRTVYSTKHWGIKGNCQIQSIPFRFRIQNLQRVDQTGSFFIFWIRASLYVCKHSLESLKRLACLSQYTQKGEKEFFKLLTRDVINAFAYSNLTLVKGGAEGGTGAFGELVSCAYLWKNTGKCTDLLEDKHTHIKGKCH